MKKKPQVRTRTKPTISSPVVEAEVKQLVLDSESLFSKFGFNDGDIPEDFSDWLYDNHREAYMRLSIDEWHRILQVLVRDRLLPHLDEELSVYDITTSHNPIRTEDLNRFENINHVCVSVSFDDVLNLLVPIPGEIVID